MDAVSFVLLTFITILNVLSSPYNPISFDLVSKLPSMTLNVSSSSQASNSVLLSSEFAQSLTSPSYTATSISSSSEPNSVAHVAPPSPRSFNSPNVSPDGGNVTLPTEEVRLSSLTAEERKLAKGKMRAIDPPADDNSLEGSPQSVAISMKEQEAANTLLILQSQLGRQGSSAGSSKLSTAIETGPQSSSLPVSDPMLVQSANVPSAAAPTPTREDRRPIAGTRRKAKLAAIGKLVMPSPSLPPEMSEAEASQTLDSELEDELRSQSVNTEAVAQFDEAKLASDQQLGAATLQKVFGQTTALSPHDLSVDVPPELDTERQLSTSQVLQAPSPKPADGLHNPSRRRQKATEPNSKSGAAAPIVLVQAPPNAMKSMPQPTLADYKRWAGVGNANALNPTKLNAQSTRSTAPEPSSSLPVMAVDIDVLKPTRGNIQARTSTVMSGVRAPAAPASIFTSSMRQTITASASSVSRSSVSTTPNAFHQRSPNTPLSTLPKSTAPLVKVDISPATTSRNSMAKPVSNSLLAASGTSKKVHAIRNGLQSTKKKDQKADDDGDDEMLSPDDLISAFKKGQVRALRGSHANTSATALRSPAAPAHGPSPPPPTPVQKVFQISAESRDELQGTGALDSAKLSGYDASSLATSKDAEPESMSGVEITENQNRSTDGPPTAPGTVEKTAGPQEAQADEEPSPAESGLFIKSGLDGGFSTHRDSPMSESDNPFVPTDNDAKRTNPADSATNIATDQSSTAAISDTQVSGPHVITGAAGSTARSENELNSTTNGPVQPSQEAKAPLGASDNVPPTQDAAMAIHDPTRSPTDSQSGVQQPEQISEMFSPAAGVSRQDTTATQSEQASTPAVDTPTPATSGSPRSPRPAPAAHGSTSNDAASPAAPHHQSAPLGTAPLEETNKVSTTHPLGGQPFGFTNTPASIPISHADTALDDDVRMISVQEVDKVKKVSGLRNFRGLGFSIPREQPSIDEQRIALTPPVIDENPYRSSLSDEVMDNLTFSLEVMYLEDVNAMEVDEEDVPGGLSQPASIPQPSSGSASTAFATGKSIGRLYRSEAANEVLPMDVDDIEIPIRLPPKPTPIVQAAVAPPVIEPAVVGDYRKDHDRPAVVACQSIPVDDEECLRKFRESLKQRTRFHPNEVVARHIMYPRKPGGREVRGLKNVHARPFWEPMGPEAFVKTTDLSQDRCQTLSQKTVASFEDPPRTRARSQRQTKPKPCKARPFPDKTASASAERAESNSSKPSEVAERLEVDQIGSKEPSASQSPLADSVSPSTSWPFGFVQTPLRGLFRRLAMALAA